MWSFLPASCFGCWWWWCLARQTFGQTQPNCCCVLDPTGFYVRKNMSHKASMNRRDLGLIILGFGVNSFGIHGTFVLWNSQTLKVVFVKLSLKVIITLLGAQLILVTWSLRSALNYSSHYLKSISAMTPPMVITTTGSPTSSGAFFYFLPQEKGFWVKIANNIIAPTLSFRQMSHPSGHQKQT